MTASNTITMTSTMATPAIRSCDNVHITIMARRAVKSIYQTLSFAEQNNR